MKLWKGNTECHTFDKHVGTCNTFDNFNYCNTILLCIQLKPFTFFRVKENAIILSVFTFHGNNIKEIHFKML